jgi:hypothetical protein
LAERGAPGNGGSTAAAICVQTLATQAERARRWAAESEAARERQVQHAVLEERMTIARELHDIVAHRISALSLQAQVVRRSIEAGKPVAAEQVRTIESAAQQSMTDLRRLLGLLRPDGERADLDPQASLDDLSNLLETARSTGHPVRFTQSGTSSAAPAGHIARRVPDRAGGADQRPPARHPGPHRGPAGLGRVCASPRHSQPGTCGATARHSRSRVARDGRTRPSLRWFPQHGKRPGGLGGASDAADADHGARRAMTIRVLVVDDQPLIRDALAALLAPRGMSTWWARRRTERPLSVRQAGANPTSY